VVLAGELMETVPIVTSGKQRYFFEEKDVRHLCGIMRCGDSVEECIQRLKTDKMECVLCYSMLQLYNKPFKRVRKDGKKTFMASPAMDRGIR